MPGRPEPLIKTYRARKGSVVGERWLPPVEFLAPSDARTLYRSLHQWRLLVLTFTAIYVRRDPSRQPVERRAALDLETFVEHKAAFHLVRAKGDIGPAVAQFCGLQSSLSCEGEDDPRCLPLHVFSVDQRWSSLSNRSGREDFARTYGAASSRLDRSRKRWTRAQRGAYHGSELLVVANHELPRGMHWDVTSERGTARLLTSDEIWKVPDATRGHIADLSLRLRKERTRRPACVAPEMRGRAPSDMQMPRQAGHLTKIPGPQFA